ncbi:MAG: rhomboid family intramembrane serine protease [Deferribacterales bacterium]
MFPLSDSFKTGIYPVVTWVIILINVVVFWMMYMGQNPHPDQYIIEYGLIARNLFIPDEVLPLSGKITPVIAHMFMHGGFMHILGNMYFLFIFGDNVEERMGHVGFSVMYFVFGLCAAFVQVLSDIGSQVPMVGASGALAGVMGAYMIYFPQSQVRTLFLLPFFIRIVEIPALIYMLFWLGMQFMGVLGSGSGVAFLAHIGGFAAGVVFALIHRGLSGTPHKRYYRI